jgi:hypothetical protein
VLQTVNPPALVLTVAALIAVLRYDVPMTVVLAAGAVLGMAWSW